MNSVYSCNISSCVFNWKLTHRMENIKSVALKWARLNSKAVERKIDHD